MKERTIAAISTPAGYGGIGIVRISGENAFDIANKVFKPFNKAKKISELKGYTGTLGRVFDKNGEIDDAILFVYRAPKSYTGENVAELSCHGGIYSVQAVLRACIDAGAFLAQPGEFTKRAFFNGKLDLTEAEAVMDLISAQSAGAMKMALSARDGIISTEIKELVESLVGISAHLGAWADYPEEEIIEVDEKSVLKDLKQIYDKIQIRLDNFDVGRMIRQGANTVIAGKPNVGKSSLMNMLLGEKRSIVTDIAGTTRDIIEEQVMLEDMLLRISDTAGIRLTDDVVEGIGVEMAKEKVKNADIVLAVFDLSQPLSDEDFQLLDILENENAIGVINKSDLESKIDESQIKQKLKKIVYISAKNSEGKKELAQAISEVLGLNNVDYSSPIIAGERQRECLLNCQKALGEAIEALEMSMTLDAVSVCIDYSLEHLLELTGERVSDKVVDKLFASFCVGK